MNALHIGISGINAVDNPGPGVGVARSLKEDTDFDASLVGLAYDAMDPGIYMDWLFDRCFVMPYPSGAGQVLVDRLAHIKATCGLDLVIPNLDSELPVYVKYEDELRRLGIETFLPTSEQIKCRGKDRLPDVAARIGIESPRTEVVTNAAELSEAVEKLGLPVIVKGALCGAHGASTHAQALEHFSTILKEWGAPVIVQQIVHGEEMNVVAVGDGDGGLLGVVGIKKSWITSLGKIWTGMTVNHEGMLSAARAFAEWCGWRGPFELECIVAPDDTVYLIEINPRFPAWSYFATGVGQNLPAMIVNHLHGRPTPRPDPVEAGKLFIRYTYELVTDMTPFQRMALLGES